VRDADAVRARDNRFFFVHGRKAGGRSIKAALSPFVDPEDEHYLHSGVLSGTVDKRPEVGVWDRQALTGVPILANVRNPFDRAVSAWRYFGLGTRTHGRRMGFAEFVAHLPTAEEHGWHAWMHATCSYSTVLVDADGPMWTHLIRFERLAEDFCAACEAIDIHVQLGHLNSGEAHLRRRSALLRAGSGWRTPAGLLRLARQGGTYRDFYTVKARRAVEEAFADDLDRFDYSF
jgi:hypothetical protein